MTTTRSSLTHKSQARVLSRVFVFVFVFGFAFVLVALSPLEAVGGVIQVPADFAVLQDAVDAAAAGDVVLADCEVTGGQFENCCAPSSYPALPSRAAEAIGFAELTVADSTFIAGAPGQATLYDPTVSLGPFPQEKWGTVMGMQLCSPWLGLTRPDFAVVLPP